MVRGLVLTLALLAAGCVAPEPTEADPAPTSSASPLAPSPTPAPSPQVALSGEWRVAGIDGAAFDEPYGLALRADARRIWSEPLCAGVIRGYSIDGDAFRSGPDPDLPPRGPNDPTRPVCAIGLPPRLADVMRAIDAADTIARTPANGVLISGGGHSVLLFSQ